MYRIQAWIAAVLSILLVGGTEQSCPRLPFVGLASWYGFHWEGRKTASGAPFRSMGWTAASRTLPLGTWIRLTNLHNGMVVVAEINDRGPYVRGRIIDLSLGTAMRLGMLGEGVVPVRVEAYCGPPPSKLRKARRRVDV